MSAYFHANCEPHSRSKSHSAVAASAYRTGTRLVDDRASKALGGPVVHDYSRRRGVVHAEIMLPPDAPQWGHDRQLLWNYAEGAESRCNSTIARDWVVALDHRLAHADRVAVTREIARRLVDRYAFAVDIAMHRPHGGGDKNWHAHILSSTRVLGAGGFGAKTRVLDDRKTGPQEIVWFRAMCAGVINAALEAAGLPDRVDHRSLVEQREEALAVGNLERAAELDRPAQRRRGRAVSGMVRRGERSEVAERQAEEMRREKELIEARRAAVADEQSATALLAAAEAAEMAAVVTLAEVQAEIAAIGAGGGDDVPFDVDPEQPASSTAAVVDDQIEIDQVHERLRVVAVGVLVLVGRGATTLPAVPVAILGYRSAIAGQAVEYRRDDDGAVAFVDCGDRLAVCVLERDALRAALTIAAERWGTVRIDGAAESLLRARYVAAELGVQIEVDGPPALETTAPAPRLRTDRDHVEAEQDDGGRRRTAPIVRREWRSLDPPAPRAGRWQLEVADVLAELARWREAAERLRELGDRLRRAAEDARRRGGAWADGERDDRRAGQLRGLLATMTGAIVEGVQQLLTRVGWLVDRLQRLAVDERKDEAEAVPLVAVAVAPRNRRQLTLFERLQAEAAERAATLAARTESLPGNGGDEYEEASPLSGASSEQQAGEVEPRDQVDDGLDDALRAPDPDDWSAPGM